MEDGSRADAGSNGHRPPPTPQSTPLTTTEFPVTEVGNGVGGGVSVVLNVSMSEIDNPIVEDTHISKSACHKIVEWCVVILLSISVIYPRSFFR